jgi:hypothetical protein
VREIGDRGKPKATFVGVAPTTAAHAPAAAVPQASYTPTMQTMPPNPQLLFPETPQHQGGGGTGIAFADMMAFAERQMAFVEKQREHDKQLREELEAQAKDKAAPVAVIPDEQLAALQVRLEVLHTARLITDDELFALEVSPVNVSTVHPKRGLASRRVNLTRLWSTVACRAGLVRRRH